MPSEDVSWNFVKNPPIFSSASKESFVRCWNGEENTHRYKKYSKKAITYTSLEGYPTIHLLAAGD